MDITNFINQFINIMIYLFTWIYTTLSSITFAGINLLQYIITIMVLGVIIEILFTLVSSNGISSSREYMKNEKRKKIQKEIRKVRRNGRG